MTIITPLIQCLNQKYCSLWFNNHRRNYHYSDIHQWEWVCTQTIERSLGIRLLVLKGRLSDGDVKGRSPDINNHIWLIHVCKNPMIHAHTHTHTRTHTHTHTHTRDKRQCLCYGQLSVIAYNWLCGPLFESLSSLSDGNVKCRSPDVNNHNWIINICIIQNRTHVYTLFYYILYTVYSLKFFFKYCLQFLCFVCCRKALKK